MSLVIKTAELKAIATGNYTTVAASDSVNTGLREVLYATATLQSDPILAVSSATAAIPDQTASPGMIIIKTWKSTASGDATPTAATTFGKVVGWVAYGK